ncbi:sensor domain-containing diguanylate cyclase [Aquisalimonas sp.]|uniref:sensor domain-containing diguanylate cyclase n=1 Tax=Aquisalimonas sp. TaxID=1872621 RepID=UPI0025C6876C|nr:sensor domain-containing diguanylate cyclase [Aquisalimonas sp.]
MKRKSATQPDTASYEARRQSAVDELLLLTDTGIDSAFERVTHLVATQLHVPISAFSVVDRDRQCFRWAQGIDIEETPREGSFCGYTILQDDIFIVSNARRHKGFKDNPLVTGETNIAFYAGAPVRTPSGHKIGSLCALDNRPRRLTSGMRQALLDLRGILEALIELLTLSMLDHLTGLYNRRHFDDVIDREWRRACRLRLPVALLTIDIDNFKSYNDTYGHNAGDQCLRKIAETVKTECKRSGDIPFRIGGEEFAVLLTVTDHKQAYAVAMRLHRAIRAMAISHTHSPSKIVSLSIGLAATESLPKDGSGFRDFILCSDEALYAAKHQGRDRVVARRFSVTTGCRAAEPQDC